MNTQKLNEGEKNYQTLLNDSVDKPQQSLGNLCVEPTYLTVIDKAENVSNNGDISLVQNTKSR